VLPTVPVRLAGRRHSSTWVRTTPIRRRSPRSCGEMHARTSLSLRSPCLPALDSASAGLSWTTRTSRKSRFKIPTKFCVWITSRRRPCRDPKTSGRKATSLAPLSRRDDAPNVARHRAPDAWTQDGGHTMNAWAPQSNLRGWVLLCVQIAGVTHAPNLTLPCGARHLIL
jgi:hypothetical protein